MRSALFKFFAVFILCLALMSGVIAAGVGIFAWRRLSQFAQTAMITPRAFIDMVRTGWSTTPQQENHRITFLLLGSDVLAQRGHQTALTDTIILASLNLQSGAISLYSLPRDLWSEDYKTKINALYAYGLQKYPDQPQRFSTEVIAGLADLKIQHTIVVTLDQLGRLIDLIGGIDVDIQHSFVDTQFPREDVDVQTVHDPAKLYETVTFNQGIEHMNGVRALEFIRSRHAIGDEGTDDARSARQQRVIAAFFARLKNPNVILNPTLAGKLYAFYNTEFGNVLPITEVLGIIHALVPARNSITFSFGKPTEFPADPIGTITHPIPTAKYDKQWVYIIRDPATFKTELHRKLNLE